MSTSSEYSVPALVLEGMYYMYEGILAEPLAAESIAELMYAMRVKEVSPFVIKVLEYYSLGARN